MHEVFLAASWLGCIVLALSLVLSLVGIDDHFGELSMDDGLDLLNVRVISTAAGAFGLSGLGLARAGLGTAAATLLAVLIGVGAGLGVAAIFRLMKRAESDGTVRMELALGESGSAYLPIPGDGQSGGKVLLTLGGRTVECYAVTRGRPIARGAKVIITEVLDSGTVEVQPYPSLEELL
ncbi:MAG: hypothetical protein M3409_01380 [Gemmatimonadota bacterium]|nr:hypothetical protein [Gemmatimonadota bacterium]